MGHYKSNLRDLQFNLFELFEAGEGPRRRRVRRPRPRHRQRHAPARSRPCRRARWPSRSPTPTATPPVFDPETHSVSIPEGFKKAVAAFQEGGWQFTGQREDRRRPRPRSTEVGHVGNAPGRAAGRLHVHGRHLLRRGVLQQRHGRAEEVGGDHRRARVGNNHGADRARRRVRRRRRPHQAIPEDGTWTSRASSASSPRPMPTTCSRTSCTWCSPARGVLARHQGSVAVLPPEDALRFRDPGVRRAQRRVRHQRRAQDGPEGVDDL